MNFKAFGFLALVPTIGFSLTLQEMVVQSVDTNPLVKIQKQKKMASDEQLRQVYADYLPNLDALGNIGVEQTDTKAKPDGDSLTKYDTSIVLKENIFKGLDTVYGVEAGKAGVQSANYKVQDSVNSLSLKAIAAYLNLLKAKELVAIAQDSVDVHTRILEKIEKKVDAGVQRQSLFDQTLSRSESAKSSLLSEQQNYENAVESFKKVLDIEVSADDLVEVATEKIGFESKEDILAAAVKNHPALKSGNFDIVEAKANFNKSSSKYMPSVDLQAEAKFRNNINGQEGKNNSVAGLVVMNYNLYNGGADQAKRAEKMHVMQENREKLANTKRNIKEKLFIAWNTHNFSSKQIVHLEKHMASAGKTVQDYHKEYELGRRSLVDLLNSELEFNAAKSKVTVTKYQEKQSYYDILAHSGTLLEKFQIAVK